MLIYTFQNLSGEDTISVMSQSGYSGLCCKNKQPYISLLQTPKMYFLLRLHGHLRSAEGPNPHCPHSESQLMGSLKCRAVHGRDGKETETCALNLADVCSRCHEQRKPHGHASIQVNGSAIYIVPE